MSFESSKFQSGVNKTITSLDKLKASLKFPEAGKGLDDISRAAGVDLGHIAKGIDVIKDRLGALRLAAVAVFAEIAAKALSVGKNLLSALTIDPMKAGFKEYSLNLNSIQTILANTQASGATLKDVNAALKELNEYSDKTIYNFGQMARSIGTFTAAGVDLKTSVASIKGISNVAALSGSNAEQASHAMQQLGQAIATGTVRLQDWISVEKAGLGGAVFQRALATTAQNMGTLSDGAVKLIGPMKTVSVAGKSFRQSLSMKDPKTGESWLTTKVLTDTLKQFTGDLSDAELAAQGFTDAQIDAIQKTAKTAKLAATEVKTLSQVFQVAGETAGSGWAQSFEIIFGNFSEAKKTFTSLSETINGFINTNADARNKVLADWKELGGRHVLINALITTFHNLMMVVKPIKDAFREIFPATTGKDLYNLTLRFRDFANALKPGKETIDNLKRTFAGVFAVLDIGKQIVKGIFSMFGRLFGAMHEGSGGFLEFTARIGDWLVKLDESLKKGNKLQKFFLALGAILAAPIKFILALGDAFRNAFSGFSSGGVSKQIDGMNRVLGPFQRILEACADAWANFVDGFGGTQGVMQKVVDGIVTGIQNLGMALGKAASTMSFEPILAVIRTGLLGGIFLMFKNFFGKGSMLDQIGKGFGKGIIGNISGSFKALEGSMKAMQTGIKAKTLKDIAIAVALLTASVVALSFVDPKKLSASLTAMTFAFGELLGAMAILTKISGMGGFLKIPAITASMIMLAAAIDILSIAVIALSRLSWGELLRGLAGIGGSMLILVKSVRPLSASSPGLIRAGIGITAIAIGLRIMASAIEAMGKLDFGTLVKGLGSVAVSLGILVKSMNKMPTTGMVSAGIALIGIAVGLRILANAVQAFASMSLEELAKGLGAVAITMGILVFSMMKMPGGKAMAAQAAGLLILSVALQGIVKAIGDLGGMSLEQLAKGLGSLGLAIGGLAAGLYLMSGTFAGAKALALAAAGLAVLAPAIIMLGKQKWSTIVKGLVTLAAALAVIGIAGALMTTAVPALLGLGAALLLIGGSFALVGAGIFLISAGISALAVALPTGVGVIIAAILELEKAIPEMAKNLILGLLEIADMLAKTAPAFVDAIVKIIASLLDAVIQSAPKFAEAFIALIDAALSVVSAKGADIIQSGYDLLIAFLQGIKTNIGQIVTTVALVIVEFLRSVTSKLGDIIKAGLNLLLSFLKGVASGIGKIVSAVGDIIVKFLTAFTSNLPKILLAGVSLLVQFLKGIAANLPRVISAAVDVIVSFITGITKALPKLIPAAVGLITAFCAELGKQVDPLAQAALQLIIDFLNGLSKAIETKSEAFGAAAAKLGLAMIKGMALAIKGGVGEIKDALLSLIPGPLKKFAGRLGIGSPSKVFYSFGEYIVQGLALGITKTNDAHKAVEHTATSLITLFEDIFQTHSPSQVMMEIGKYVGEGFALGLKSSISDINSVWAELNQKLTQAMKDASETIVSEQKKLKELLAASKPDAKAIAESQKVISQNQILLEKSTAAHTALLTTLKREKTELLGLASDYEKLSAKLEKAEADLEAKRQVRKDFIDSTSERFNQLPEIATEAAAQIKEANAIVKAAKDELDNLLATDPTNTDKIQETTDKLADAKASLSALTKDQILTPTGELDIVATYLRDLKGQTAAVKAYDATLQQLRKLGLDDATYQKLVEEGTADQAFATQLLAGGKTAVKGLNKLDLQLKTASDTLALHAGNNLYNAGVASAKGLIRGLLSQKDKLTKEIEQMARDIVAAFNRILKVKSPSRVFMEIGVNVMKGLAIGLSSSTKMVTDAIKDSANNAVSEMQNTLSKISNAVMGNIDTNPVITPILDLTQVRSAAGELGALTNVTPITAASSYGQASLISAQQTATEGEDVITSPGGTAIKFEQNNYSPTALTEIEIYRQTKNQLSQLKSTLGVT